MSLYGTAINCMDGKVQGAVRKHLTAMYGVKYVDKITDAGPVKLLAENTNRPIIQNMQKLLEISLVKHRSRIIAIAAHHQCAGNPISKKRQIRQLRKARRRVKKMIKPFGLNVTIILLWIDERWMPHEVSQIPAWAVQPQFVISQ